MGFETAIQMAVYQKLSGDVALMAKVNAVHDDVPQPIDSGDSSLFPYVSIGEDFLTEWDTKDASGVEASITVHTWSRYKGRKETKEIQALIFDALQRANLNVIGYNFVDCNQISSESMIDADGKTRHGVQTFRILITEI